MRHVCPDEMACCECTAQTELACKNCSTNDPGQLAGILPWIGRVGSLNTEHLQHDRLCFKNRSSADGTNLERGHRHTDLKITVVADEGQ